MFNLEGIFLSIEKSIFRCFNYLQLYMSLGTLYKPNLSTVFYAKFIIINCYHDFIKGNESRESSVTNKTCWLIQKI